MARPDVMKSVSLVVTRLQWLTPQTFEIRFQRPPGFKFIRGQKIQFSHQECRREYTLMNAQGDNELAICVRLIPNGRFSPILARAEKGDHFQATAAYGYFVYQSAETPAVFLATGTGIAPFVAFTRSGVRGFHLLHGVRNPDELYYQDTLQKAAASYTPCLSSSNPAKHLGFDIYSGHVTDYLANLLPKGCYAFYLCGRGDMVGDATRIIDQQFEGSKVFTERYD